MNTWKDTCKRIAPFGLIGLLIGGAASVHAQSGPVPAVDAIFFSDRAVGSVLVLTGQPDAQVIIDGKAMSHKTMPNGQLRIPNLPTTSHTVSVAKDGFKSVEAQKIDVLKGQEKQVTFVFEPLAKPSSLSLEHVPAGAQVVIDGTPIGTVAPNGTLTDANVTPGEHTLVFTQPGYPALTIKKTFLANEPVRLSSSDINWKHSQATLDVIVAANTAVPVMRGNQSAGHSTGPNKFPLDEGTYTITARAANGQENTQTVSLSAGESRPLDMRSQTPAGDTMDQWSSKWIQQQDKWYTHKGGGYVLYTGQRGAGNITFTVKMRKRNIFGGAPHIKWVVNFVDDRNYLLFELDNKSFYQTEVVNGNKQETIKKPYNLGNAEFIHINIVTSANTLQQRCTTTTANNTWQILTDWGPGAATPSLSQNKNRNFAEGSFGFYLQGNDEIEISNFSYKR